MTRSKDTMGTSNISVDISVDHNDDGMLPSYLFGNISELDLPAELSIPGHTPLWVAKTVNGQTVDDSYNKALRQGYRIASHEDFPDVSDYYFGKFFSGEKRTGPMEKGGLVFMICPTVINKKIKAHYENESRLQKENANFFNKTKGVLDSYDNSKGEFKRSRDGSFGE